MKPASKIRCYVSLLFTLLCVVVRVKGLRYLSGDFLNDPSARSPYGGFYPKHDIDKFITNLPEKRSGRAMQFLNDPWATRKTLLEWQQTGRIGRHRSFEEGREIRQTSPETSNTVILPPDIDATVRTRAPPTDNSTLPSTTTPIPLSTAADSTVSSCESASSAPQRLCRTKFNTTAPMYGVSLTSGKPVTIVQKFPDLLQQVIFEVCASDRCDVIHGECVQTYVPYLFLVIPLGPVTLTGQDYVLVESGCVCRPKYAGPQPPPNPLDEINFGLGV